MSLLFCDSFDHYTTLSQKYNFISSPAGDGSTSIESAGRFGGSCLRTNRSSGGGAHYVQWNAPDPTTYIVGFAFQIVDSREVGFYTVWDSSTTNQHTLTFDLFNRVQFRRGGPGGTILGTTSKPMTPGVFHYFEMKVVINDTTGAVEIRIDGETVLDLTNVDTRNGGSGNARLIRFGCPTTVASYYWRFDDIYFCDDQNGINDDFLGDVRVQALLADGAGDNADWTPLSGNNFENIDETPPDDDTSYVASATANDIDTYSYPALSGNPADVAAVQIMWRARRDDATSRSARAICRSDTTNGAGATENMPDAYTYFFAIFETDPDTTSAWTVSGINAAEYGVELIT